MSERPWAGSATFSPSDLEDGTALQEATRIRLEPATRPTRRIDRDSRHRIGAADLQHARDGLAPSSETTSAASGWRRPYWARSAGGRTVAPQPDRVTRRTLCVRTQPISRISLDTSLASRDTGRVENRGSPCDPGRVPDRLRPPLGNPNSEGREADVARPVPTLVHRLDVGPCRRRTWQADCPPSRWRIPRRGDPPCFSPRESPTGGLLGLWSRAPIEPSRSARRSDRCQS